MSDRQDTDLVKAGAAVRRHLRARLDAIGAQWVEHRGLLSSTFVVTATREQWREIEAVVRLYRDRRSAS